MHACTYICLVAAVNYRPDEAFFTQYFQWRDDVPSRLHVIRKSDGQLLTTINTTAVFVTHQVSVRRMTFDAGMSLRDMLKYKCFDVYLALRHFAREKVAIQQLATYL